MAAPTPKPFSLAIVGGGISGLILALALLTHESPIPLTIYESAAAFGEIGAGVGFQPNFVRVMERISPRLKEAFLRCCKTGGGDDGSTGDAPPIWFTVRIGDRRKADSQSVVRRTEGKEVKLDDPLFQVPARDGPQGGVHRAHFLAELVKLLPDGLHQFRKRLVDIVEADDGSGDAVLHFADGSSARHTAVIGCDGIKSRTREVVLGEAEARPVFSGKYAYRGLIAMEKAVQILGEERTRASQLYAGHKGHVLTFPIAHGTITNVVAFSSKDEWADPEWVVPASQDQVLADYAAWTPTVKSIMANLHKPDVWALYNHTPARTFYKARPRVCLLGDAAHASTPHQGGGAGMCVEDAYVLGKLLAEVEHVDGLAKAFWAFDAVRRPRTLKFVETSREAGRIWDLEGLAGDDLEAFGRDACGRMVWIWDHDVDADVEHALLLLRGQCVTSAQHGFQV